MSSPSRSISPGTDFGSPPPRGGYSYGGFSRSRSRGRSPARSLSSGSDRSYRFHIRSPSRPDSLRVFSIHSKRSPSRGRSVRSIVSWRSSLRSRSLSPPRSRSGTSVGYGLRPTSLVYSPLSGSVSPRLRSLSRGDAAWTEYPQWDASSRSRDLSRANSPSIGSGSLSPLDITRNPSYSPPRSRSGSPSPLDITRSPSYSPPRSRSRLRSRSRSVSVVYFESRSRSSSSS